jgi:hypothetical protein
MQRLEVSGAVRHMSLGGKGLITHNDSPHSVGLLWTSDQLAAETST